jgi:hypothetical protein
MRKIKFIHFNYLRREAHYQFLELFNRLLDSYSEVKEIVGVFYVEFTLLLAKEKKMVDTQTNSDYTAKIVAADHRDDRLLIGIKKIVAIATRHFNPIIVEAAISLQNRLKPFGDIIRKSYEEEAAAIRILLADLQGEYAEKVDLVGLTPWIMELEIAVTDFERLLQLRNTEQAEKPLERLREVRVDIEATYRNMIERFNAFCIIEEKEVYNEFINQLNAQIDYFNEHNHRASAKDIKSAVVKPIPAQTYAGKPITPVPEVMLEETELVFAKDFTLTYKNNESIGNAEIIIHGKGAYKGNKSITFFISENSD